MQHLLKMIEVAKNGITIPKRPLPHADLNQISQQNLFDLFEKCQPFVFKRKNIEAEDIDHDFIENGLALDAPFSVFSIEMADGLVTVPRPEDKIKVTIICILAHEVAPKNFSTYVLAKIDNGIEEHTTICPMPLDSLLEYYIKRINHEKIGQENIRQVVKIGTGKNKKIHRFRKIIHVSPNRDKDRNEIYAGKNIEWTHKWLVRGHWRKHSGVGKDRVGKYCIPNFTWIMEHEKGPVDALIVKKTRVID